MGITGRYFCSYNIKGLPYNEEFKIVLEASVSVYNDLGALQTCIVSKLHSEPFVIKTLMEENLDQSLEFSDAVFGKQIDEIQEFNTCKAMRRYDETLSVKSLLERKKILDGKGRHDLSKRNYVKILQNIRIDFLKICLPDDLTQNDERRDVKAESIDEIPQISIKHKKVLPLDTKDCNVSQHKEIQNEHSAGIEASNIEIKTESELTETIKQGDCIQEKGVFTCKKVDNNNCSLSTENVFLEPVLLETPDVIVNMNTVEKFSIARDLDGNKGFDKPLKAKCPDTDNFETNEVVDDVDNDDVKLMLFCAEVQKNEIGPFLNVNLEGSAVSNTEEQNELTTLPVVVDHAYKKRNRARKRNKKKTNTKAKGYKKDVILSLKRKNETSLTKTILTDHELEDTDMKTENIKRSRSNDQKAKQINSINTSRILTESDAEQSDLERNDILGPRKRRRCTRNVNYKALADGLDSAESESEELVLKSDVETVLSDYDFRNQTEAPSDTKKLRVFDDPDYQSSDLSEMLEDESNENSGDAPSNKRKLKTIVDADYQPSDLSESSEEESDLGEESQSDVKLTEENEEKSLKQIGKKKKFAEMETKIDLDEHKDKFETVKFVSTEQRNRGKPLEEKSHDAFSCKICNTYQTSDKDVMSFHIGQHLQGKLCCKFCELESSSVLRNLSHMRKEHTIKYMSILSVCEQCGILFSKGHSRNTHMYRVHKVPAFECQLCLEQDTSNEEKFATLKNLHHHIKERHPRACHECSMCGKIYTNKKFYDKHNCKNKSDETQILKCVGCGNVYDSKNDLHTHRRNVHRKEKLSKCTMCDYVAFRSTSISRHMAHAHLDAKKHQCELCPFSAVQACQLKSHMRTHTKDKPFKCDQCSYAAAWNVQLKDHLKVHELSNTVTCQKCGVVLKDDKALKRHNSRDHADNTETAKGKSLDV